MSFDRFLFNYSDHKITTYTFNPYEIAFCGFSGCGKTTLITKLINKLTSSHRIGYVKHDAHKFDIDKPGKDTYRAAQSGAKSILINDSHHMAYIRYTKSGSVPQKILMQDSDLVFIEGYKKSLIPKFIFVDQYRNLLKEIRSNKHRNVIAAILKEKIKKSEEITIPIPCFHRNDVIQIKRFIERHINKIKLIRS